MIEFDEARRIALEAARAAMRREVVILDIKTEEKVFGWIFHYQSEAFVRDNAKPARLFGNAPIIVNRENGRVTFTGTSFPIGDYVRAYEALGPDGFESESLRQFLAAKVEPIE